ncbi:MAG: hypothetical protein WCW31_03945 [Patescibacteria group bacterium]|jgi:hypothetical protein
MTLEEATKLYKVWQNYMEFHDKLFALFLASIPESFLPFPKEDFEEALNIVSKQYYDNKNYSTAELIQKTIDYLNFYEKDEKALQRIAFQLNDPMLRGSILVKLKDAQSNWLRINLKLNSIDSNSLK